MPHAPPGKEPGTFARQHRSASQVDKESLPLRGPGSQLAISAGARLTRTVLQTGSWTCLTR